MLSCNLLNICILFTYNLSLWGDSEKIDVEMDVFFFVIIILIIGKANRNISSAS